MPWFSRKAKVVDETTEQPTKDDETKLKDLSSSGKDSSGTRAEDEDDEMNDKAQDVLADAMGDNLDVMRDIVFRIREDEEFAKSIYANCPRLQKHLDEHPDLRPIFEDPKLVRINFEKVYRDQGGVLPEDEPEKPPGPIRRAYDGFIGYVAIITGHPLFKVFKIFMVIKKIIGFLSPTKGFGMIQGFFLGLLEDPDAEPPDVDGDADAEGGNPANLEMKMQLNAAAEHMEDPEVQERMEDMLESPDTMDETIENDPQLKALRDENPLCKELMSDPETMKILVDPDNLRALGEAPDLIELDFQDPGGFVPDEVPDIDAPDAPEVDGLGDAQVEDPQTEARAAVEPEAEAEDGGNLFDDVQDDLSVEETDNNAAKAKGGKQSKQEQKQQGDQDEARGWISAAAGVIGGQALASLGLSDMVFGGDDDLGVGATEGVEGVAAPTEVPTETGLEGAVPTEDPLAATEGLGEAELPETEEGGLAVQEMEGDVDVGGKKQAAKAQQSGGEDAGGEGGGGIFGAISGAATGFVAGTMLGSVLSEDQFGMVSDLHENYEDRKEEMEEEEDEDGEGADQKKKGRFAFVGAMKDLAKDTVISSTLGDIVGDDMADNILDAQEEIEELGEEEEEEEEEEDDYSKGSGDQLQNDKSKPSEGAQQGAK